MKNSLVFIVTRILVGLTFAIAVVNLGEMATAQPTVNASTKQVRRCTAKTCTPYRANFERAIATRVISRPSLVPDEARAIALADQAMSRGDRNEAARRLAQALVIISERKGVPNAYALERALDSDLKNKRGQSLREFLPLFERIFPPNKDPYR